MPTRFGQKKKENGGLDADESIASFNKLCSKPKAKVDFKGENPKYKKRVAVKVKDVIKKRRQDMRKGATR